MKKIVLTGGGTAGHVTPNIALLPSLREAGYEISYIGSYDGIEKQLIEAEGIPYYGISSGKLRRYFDLKNFTDPFRVQHGYHQALILLGKIKPDIIFSKGGFVSVPVVGAARARRIPVIIHESDMTPGLANKLAFPSATRVCCNFPETMQYLPAGKAVLTGCPIRSELLSGDPEKGRMKCHFSANTGAVRVNAGNVQVEPAGSRIEPQGSAKPVLLIIGGSQGSVAVNTLVRRNLPAILEKFCVIHLCGKGNLDPALEGTEGYVQFEYIREELPDLFALADIVISRAGANAICELQALRKPSLLIPLPLSASRGDQVLNAKSFKEQGFSEMLEEETMTDEVFLQTIDKLWRERDSYIDAMNQSKTSDAIGTIMRLITEITASKAKG